MWIPGTVYSKRRRTLKTCSADFTPFTELLIQWLEISKSPDFSIEELLLSRTKRRMSSVGIMYHVLRHISVMYITGLCSQL